MIEMSPAIIRRPPSAHATESNTACRNQPEPAIARTRAKVRVLPAKKAAKCALPLRVARAV